MAEFSERAGSHVHGRCLQERRAIKRELQRWTKNMVFVVGECGQPTDRSTDRQANGTNEQAP